MLLLVGKGLKDDSPQHGVCIHTHLHVLETSDPIPHPRTHTCMQCTILWWLLSYTWPSQLCWGMQEKNNATMAINSIYVPPTMFNLPTLPHHYVCFQWVCNSNSTTCFREKSKAKQLFAATNRISRKNVWPNKYRVLQFSVKCSSPPLKADMQ